MRIVAYYEFELLGPKSAGRLDGVLYTSSFHGWRWLGYDELRDWEAAARASYVVRPYYPHLGTLDQLLTPEGGDLSVATGLMIRHIPFPHDPLRYPKDAGRTRLGFIKMLNDRLPVAVERVRSAGTVAIVDDGRALPSIDILPEPLRWEPYLRIERRRAAPWTSRRFGRERNLPGGGALKPVPLAGADRDYFAPLAVDPSEAAAVLTPQLLALTREPLVGWWSEGSMLFVWVHETLALRARPQLAEHARRIHRLLVRD